MSDNLYNIKSVLDFTDEELAILFDITVEEVKSVCNEKRDFRDEKKECCFNTETAAILMLDSIGDDERLIGYIKELYNRYHLNNTLLSKLTKVSVCAIEELFANPQSISIEIKYKLCIKVVYLLFLFLQRN